MHYNTIVRVPDGTLDQINKYLEPHNSIEECQDRRSCIKFTAKFPNGYEADIECIGTDFEEGEENSSWTQAVLFNENGSQISYTEVQDTYEGVWELSDNDGNDYSILVIREGADIPEIKEPHSSSRARTSASVRTLPISG